MSKANQQPSNLQLQAVFLTPMAAWATGPKKFSRKSEELDYKTDKTIPNEAFSIVELFNRYRSGQPMPQGIERPVTYGGQDVTHKDFDLGRIRQMDLAEVNMLTRITTENMKALEARREALKAQKEPVTPEPPKANNPA